MASLFPLRAAAQKSQLSHPVLQRRPLDPEVVICKGPLTSQCCFSENRRKVYPMVLEDLDFCPNS